ncbi:NADH dehydrogenase (ubiquinone) complex I, assembly factor 6 homolog sicily isoform 1-T1 [Glossina fuscipes fuscipes]
MARFSLGVPTFCVRNSLKFYQQPQRQQHIKQDAGEKELNASRYCMALVEKNDYENYLCTLLLGKGQRRHAFALRALNVELAKCGAMISDQQQLIKMRLQFWSDSIDKCYDYQKSYVADQPVLSELKHTLGSNKLNKVYLKRLVTARDRAPNQPFETVKDMENYSEQTYSSLLYLLVELCGVKDLHVDHAASHLGKAQGVVTLLRAVPYTKRGQTLNVPQELLIKNGVSEERFLRHKFDDKGVADCVFQIAAVAHQHLEKARSLADKIPKLIRKVFLPSVNVERYLERLRAANFKNSSFFSITHNSCLQRDSMLPLALYMHNLRGKY